MISIYSVRVTFSEAAQGGLRFLHAQNRAGPWPGFIRALSRVGLEAQNWLGNPRVWAP